MKPVSEVNELVNIAERRNIDNPIVSIACTTFNQRKFIKDTLEGFFIQKTTFPVEIIIHDDASTDGTDEIIKEYENRYPEIIKAIYQTENQYSKRINIAKEFVYPRIRSKYVAICEGDDYWTDPLKLEKQVSFLEQNEDYGLVYTEIDRIDGEGNIIDRRFFENEPSSFCESFEHYLVNAPFRAPCTWLFRKNVYKEREKKYNVADFPMILDIAAQSKIHRLQDTTANYRVLVKSASHFTNLHSTYSFMKGIYQVQMDYALKYKVSQQKINTIKANFAWLSYNYAVAEHDIAQVKEANKLLKDHPSVNYKFKITQFLSKFKLGRQLVKFRLNKILEFG